MSHYTGEVVIALGGVWRKHYRTGRPKTLYNFYQILTNFHCQSQCQVCYSDNWKKNSVKTHFKKLTTDNMTFIV